MKQANETNLHNINDEAIPRDAVDDGQQPEPNEGDGECGDCASCAPGTAARKPLFACVIHHPPFITLEELGACPEEVQFPEQFDVEKAIVVYNGSLEDSRSEVAASELGPAVEAVYRSAFKDGIGYEQRMRESVFFPEKAALKDMTLLLAIEVVGTHLGEIFRIVWGLDDSGIVSFPGGEEAIEPGGAIHLRIERMHGVVEQWDVALDYGPIDPKTLLPDFIYDPELARPTEFLSIEGLEAKAERMADFVEVTRSTI